MCRSHSICTVGCHPYKVSSMVGETFREGHFGGHRNHSILRNMNSAPLEGGVVAAQHTALFGFVGELSG